MLVPIIDQTKVMRHGEQGGALAGQEVGVEEAEPDGPE